MLAASSAAQTSSSAIGWASTADSQESSHSVTTGMISSPATGFFAAIQWTAASKALPISSELVSTIGLSRIPHSRIVLMPTSSPYPFRICVAA